MIGAYQKSQYACAVWDVIKLYQDDPCGQYILLLQERNFYRHYAERVRIKPDSQLWRVWFGGQLNLGLFIAPVHLPDGSWRIDHSEVRRAPYQYWTIGHILSVGGFINPVTNSMLPIKSYQDIEDFYNHLVLSLSNSVHEREICKRYIEYLKCSQDVNSEPFLIPEFQYEGLGNKFGYRMDFTILNPYTFEFVCFELSPSSLHFNIAGMKNKAQAQINAEITKMWSYECQKRNEYLAKYNLSAYTFSNAELADYDACFHVIASCLSKRNFQEPSMQDIIVCIKQIKMCRG